MTKFTFVNNTPELQNLIKLGLPLTGLRILLEDTSPQDPWIIDVVQYFHSGHGLYHNNTGRLRYTTNKKGIPCSGCYYIVARKGIGLPKFFQRALVISCLNLKIEPMMILEGQ